MMRKIKYSSYLLTVAFFFIGISCNNNAKTPETKNNKTTKKETTVAAAVAPTSSKATEPATTASIKEAVESSPAKKPVDLSIAFYNVENLFDTVDDPKTEDEEYLPTAEKKWTSERYQKKLESIYKVLMGTGGNSFPTLVGVAEVENRKVLSDLINKTELRNSNYGIVHFDSPDMRGIDVGLLYDSNQFKVEHKEKLKVYFAKEPYRKTRDVLYVNGLLNDELVHIFVNHWSSRRDGKDASSYRRKSAAKILRKKVNSILADNKDAKILIMGDFNDEPVDESITKVLKAKGDIKQMAEGDLFNLMYQFDKQNLGTYNYRGNWNMLDQIIISSGFLTGNKGITINPELSGIFKEDWMLYNDKKFGKTPSRTYGGPNYYGGYSDHLPIYVRIRSGY